MWNLLFESVLFVISVVLCFYLPGRFFLSKLKLHLPGITGIFITTVAGISVFTLSIYTLSWIHAVWLIIPILLFIAFYTIRKKWWKEALPKTERYPLLFVVICSLLFSLTLVVYGFHGDTVVYQHDDLWHLALTQELKVNFPPDLPIYAGVPLQGYHLFSDFLQANISNLFFLSPFNLHFYFFAILIALLWGTGVYGLMFTWTKKIAPALWAVFLTMFGGSFAYILHFQGHPEVSLKEGLSMLQPATMLYNPPLAFSIVIMIFCSILLFQYLKTHEKKWLIPFIIAAGILPMFKVYAGIILYGALVFLAIYELFKKRFFLIPVGLLTGLIALLTFGVFLGSGGGFIWHPFWPPHELLRSFAWYGYDEKIYTYTQQGVIRGLIETEVYGFSLFLLANLGTRLIGILGLFLLIKKHKPSPFALFILAMILISVLMPLLFIQTGKVFEIIQMATYYLFFVSLFAAIGFTAIFNLKYPFRKAGTILGIALIVILTLPSTVYSHYLTYTHISNPRNLSDPYLQALLFLKDQGRYNDTVLIMPPAVNSTDVKKIVAWQSRTTPEIPALTNKRVYMASVGIAYAGMDIEARAKKIYQIQEYIQNPTPTAASEIEKLLKDNGIKYIFVPYNAKPLTNIKGVTEIFSNQYYIYKVEN